MCGPCASDSTGGSSSLDDAYNSGGAITVDAYDVVLNLNDSTNDYGQLIDNTTNATIDTALENHHDRWCFECLHTPRLI